MKKIRLGGLLLALVALGIVAWFWDRSAPEIRLPERSWFGASAEVEIGLEDVGRGLYSASVEVVQGDQRATVFTEAYPRLLWPWATAATSRGLSLPIRMLETDGGLKAGAFDLIVTVEDQPNLFFFSRRTVATRTLHLDNRPPVVTPISTQHYLRQGGSEGILYRVSEPGRSGVRVGDLDFPGFPIPEQGEGVNFALFALPYDASPDVSISLWAEDEAGNRGESGFWIKVFPQQFRSRSIEITDQFIASVIPGILSGSPGYEEQQSGLETFLLVNRRMRDENNHFISETARQSSGSLLWKAPFLQLTNSQVEAVFADHRSYFYHGKECDEQTHLGFDLASLAQSPVEASNDGRVLFAGYLGIYGNMVIVDHGMGLCSLYGHLSAIDVEVGQAVVRGQSLGRTGRTGLAGGDHLHFSMLVEGVQVNPLEWWDPEWVRVHVLERIAKH